MPRLPFEFENRREFLKGTLAGAATLALGNFAKADKQDLDLITREIEKRHDETVRRLQEWIKQPSIAAENRGVSEGCDLTMRLLRDAGFGKVTRISTDGQPGIFATLDAGAPQTLGVYFMYDVKQVDPSECSSPPWDAALVDRPGIGKVPRRGLSTRKARVSFIAAPTRFAVQDGRCRSRAGSRGRRGDWFTTFHRLSGALRLLLRSSRFGVSMPSAEQISMAM
jgi:hypothetical protein